MKLLMEPIDVAEMASAPDRFCWRGQLYVVERILETWTARSQWWTAVENEKTREHVDTRAQENENSEVRKVENTKRDDHREYFLLLTTHGVMEIFNSPRGWMLSRLLD